MLSEKHPNIRAALVLAIVYVLVWGGMPVPALAKMAEGESEQEGAAEQLESAEQAELAGQAESVEQSEPADQTELAGQTELADQTEPADPTESQAALTVTDDEDRDEMDGEQPASETDAQQEDVAALSDSEGNYVGPASLDEEYASTPMEGDVSNEDLLDAYVQQEFDKAIPRERPLTAQSAYESLDGIDASIYDALKPLIIEVARGDRASTVFELDASFIADTEGWTAQDLGVDAIMVDGQITSEAKNAARTKAMGNHGKILKALLADLPYDFYWFDKTIGWYVIYPTYMIISTEIDGEPALLPQGTMTYNLSVAQEYATGTFTVNTSLGQSVQTAVANAQQVVSDNEDKLVLERLDAYRAAICDMVSYNSQAVNDDSTPYGNPWQLVWVFDGDPSTDVVCEGYSKAFKYLCDLTWPEREGGVECLLAIGMMTGRSSSGLHMWNVMHMDDGRNYLVDVTNCDEGMAGAPDKLFLVPKASGSYADGYVFTPAGYDVNYAYSDDIKEIFGESALTISDTPYVKRIRIPSAGGLVYDGTEQAGIPASDNYTLSGTIYATCPGEYTATATLAEGFEWEDGTTGSKDISWSIARRPVTVTADNVAKVVGEGDPELTATVEGTVGGDAVSYVLSRAEGEDIGEYAITASGDAVQGNYTLEFVPGRFAIRSSKDVVSSGMWGTCPWEITKSGTLTVYPGTGANQPDNTASPWLAYKDDITSVVFAKLDGKEVTLPENCYRLFYGLSNVKSMDLSKADTSSVTNLGLMFYRCLSLASLDLSTWDTSHVESTYAMFYECSSLASINLSGWDTSHVLDMAFLFKGCSSLASLDVSDWDTSSATRMNSMFSECSSLVALDLSDWDTSCMTTMGYVFYGCTSLASLDCSGWDTSQVESTYAMFYECSSLVSLNLSDWNTASVKDMSYMFCRCSSLASLDLSSWDTSCVTTMGYMFYGCTSLASISVGTGYRAWTAHMFPDATSDNGLWWSECDQQWYSKEQIVSERKYVGDTYRSSDGDLASATVSGLRSCSYDGADHRQVPTVRMGRTTLVEGVDYDLLYYRDGKVATDFKSAGKITVRVSGKGSYKGKAWATYEIWKGGQPMTAWAVARQAPAASLASRDVTVEAPIHVAHAVSAGKPMEYRKMGGDSRLGVDVATGRVTVCKATPAGTYKVTIRAIAFGGSNYADGSRTVECKVQVVSGTKLDQDFQVTAADVTRTSASLALSDYLTRPFSVAMAAGNVTYRKASGSGCLDVDTSGRLKVARGTAPGTYYVKVWVTAAGDTGYKPCTRTVTVKVVVK